MKLNAKHYFFIRVGEGSKYIDEAHKNGFVAIGWGEVPDLRKLGSSEEIKKALNSSGYKYSPAQISAQAGQLARFGLEIQEGDVLLSPLGKGEYLVGVAGDYYYEENATGKC